jgi:hypothetical protein
VEWSDRQIVIGSAPYDGGARAMSESSGSSAGWLAFAALLGALAGFGGAVATGWFSYASKDEELRVHLVEIAIGILEADPSKTDLTPARGWAMDVIDQKSGVKFSADDRSALLHQAIKSQTSMHDEIRKWKESGVPIIELPNGKLLDQGEVK